MDQVPFQESKATQLHSSLVNKLIILENEAFIKEQSKKEGPINVGNTATDGIFIDFEARVRFLVTFYSNLHDLLVRDIRDKRPLNKLIEGRFYPFVSDQAMGRFIIDVNKCLPEHINNNLIEISSVLKLLNEGWGVEDIVSRLKSLYKDQEYLFSSKEEDNTPPYNERDICQEDMFSSDSDEGAINLE